MCNKLIDHLNMYSKKDLISMYKDDIVGLSKFNKKDLVLVISSFLIEHYEEVLFTLAPKTLKLFFKACEEEVKEEETNFFHIDKILETNFAFLDYDGRLIVFDEIKEAVKDVNEIFLNVHPTFFRVYLCLLYASRYYGIVSSDVLLKLINIKKLNKDELADIANTLLPSTTPILISEDKTSYIDSKLLSKNFDKLLKEQSDKPFYYPTDEELNVFYYTDRFLNDAYENLGDFLKKHGVNKITNLSYIVYDYFYFNQNFNELVKNLVSDLEIDSEKDLKELVRLLSEANNNTRLLENRGHTPNEIFEIQYKNGMPEEVKKMLEYLSSDTPKEEIMVHNGKVYMVKPNDLCPCGSNKLYKNCCKKKKTY